MSEALIWRPVDPETLGDMQESYQTKYGPWGLAVYTRGDGWGCLAELSADVLLRWPVPLTDRATAERRAVEMADRYDRLHTPEMDAIMEPLVWEESDPDDDSNGPDRIVAERNLTFNGADLSVWCHADGSWEWSCERSGTPAKCGSAVNEDDAMRQAVEVALGPAPSTTPPGSH